MRGPAATLEAALDVRDHAAHEGGAKQDRQDLQGLHGLRG